MYSFKFLSTYSRMRKSSGSSMSSMPFLGVGATAVNTCSADNNSFFCQLSRIFQMIMWAITLFAILYCIYVFAIPYMLKRFKRSKR